MAQLRTTTSSLKGTSPGKGGPDPLPIRERRYELWVRRGRGAWRSEGEKATFEALTMRAKHFVSYQEQVGKAGQATVRAVGDIPCHLDEGEHKTRTWAQAMLDDI